MSMVKFSSQVFKVLNEKNDWENEKNDWSKCLGLPHTGYGPDTDCWTANLSFGYRSTSTHIWHQVWEKKLLFL